MSDKNRKRGRDSRTVSPEELGKLIRVTEPGGYMALFVGVLMALLVVAWGIFGFIPSKVGGFGILVPPGGVMDVVSQGQGELVEIGIAPGQKIRRGEVIARIRMIDLENQRDSAMADLRDARTWYRKRQDYFNRTLKTHETNNAKRIRFLEFQKQYLGDYFAFLKDHVHDLEKLQRSGSITGKQLEDTRNGMNAVLAQINQCEIDAANIEGEMLDLKNRAAMEILQAEERISRVVLQAENLDRSIETMTRVISPYDGVVVELSAERGDFVGPGSPIAVLKPEETLLESVIMLPLENGKKVKPGMMTYVFPSTASKEEYGCIYGLISYVSEYPVSVEGLKNIIGNPQVIENALSQGTPMLLAKVAMLRDADAASGLKWSSSKGPDRDIEAGTFARVEVVLDHSRPIDLIFPKFSKTVRIDRLVRGVVRITHAVLTSAGFESASLNP